MTIEQWGNIAWKSFSGAFYKCVNVTGNFKDTPNLNNVTNMREAFVEAKLFNTDLIGWNVSNVTDMGLMFAQATSFNQDISSWNVGSVTNMSSMFLGATAFNQSLGDWDITSVSNMTNMLFNTKLSVANYDATLQGWSQQAAIPGVNLGAQGLEYCDQLARNSLIQKSWTISGDALSASCN
nr:BspA family leucine-rich repeat surface protein [Fulvivirga sediminis]